MPQVQDVVAFLESFAPPALAESWDNVGLLLGERRAGASRVMTCLTLTPDVAAEAIAADCDLIVTHHPILFRAVQRLTGDTAEGLMLLELIRAGVAVYSPHTGYDSAAGGINAQLAELFDLRNVAPLRPAADSAPGETSPPVVGGGRLGDLPAPLSLCDLIAAVKVKLRVTSVGCVASGAAAISRLAIACGSAAEFLPDAHRAGCQALLTGEARFHACLEARALGIALILPGHYATERPGMERLAQVLQRQFPGLDVKPSASERDPVSWM